VFFPILFLNLGHSHNFLWFWQTGYIAVTALLSLLLLVIIGNTKALTTRTALSAGFCVAALPLLGGMGVVCAPALAMWLLLCGLTHCISPSVPSRRAGILFLFVGGLAISLVSIVVFSGFAADITRHSRFGPNTFLVRVSQFLAIGFGPAALRVWELLSVALPILLLISTAMLVTVSVRQPGKRLQALGLFLFIASIGSLAIAAAWGRSIVTQRYAVLSAPLWAGVYFTWEVYGRRNHRAFVQMGLVILASAMLSLNLESGLEHGNSHMRKMDAFREDLKGKMPLDQLLIRHVNALMPFRDPTPLKPAVRMLHAAQVPPFHSLRDRASLQELRLPVEPSQILDMRWENGSGYAIGNTPQLLFQVPKKQFVTGIRLTIRYGRNTPGMGFESPFRIWWRKALEEERFPRDGHADHPLFGRPRDEPYLSTLVVWVNEDIESFCIEPDAQLSVVEVLDIVLLVPRKKPELSTEDGFRGA
jgi:hypothetical protein